MIFEYIQRTFMFLLMWSLQILSEPMREPSKSVKALFQEGFKKVSK